MLPAVAMIGGVNRKLTARCRARRTWIDRSRGGSRRHAVDAARRLGRRLPAGGADLRPRTSRVARRRSRSATPWSAPCANKTGKDVDLYAVKYPADTEIDIGANDMSQRIQYMTANCPDTRLVLGGYSLGAAVTDVVLAVPIAAFGFKNPLPDGADQHIAAVALFGNGIAVGRADLANFTNPALRDRIIELCHGDDPICNPDRPGELAGQLARPPGVRLHQRRHGQPGRRLRRGQDLDLVGTLVGLLNAARASPLDRRPPASARPASPDCGRRARCRADSPRRPASAPAPARREIAGSPAAPSSVAHQAGSRRCSPTASNAPTSDRTMFQQNASALTWTVIRCPSRVQSSRCSSRIVVAPSR